MDNSLVLLASVASSRRTRVRELHPSGLEPTPRVGVVSARLARRNPLDIFPFLELPPELRIMIYRFAFNFDSLENYFNTYTNLVLSSEHPTRVPTPECRMVCPSILLANKFIYQEARHMLYDTPLVFTHGILHASLCNVISPRLLRNLTDITITDAGQDLVKTGVSITFHGVQRLVMELYEILQHEHHLKTFRFLARADDFNWHLKHCTNDSGSVPCGINAFLKSLKKSLGCLRSIGKVVFEGEMPDSFKNEMVQMMTSPPETLFKLPLKVREKIYAYAADPSDGSKALEKFMRNMRLERKPVYPKMTTPTVLLLNRQIYHEARDVIRLKKLVINGTVASPYVPTSILAFIGPGILQKVLYLELNITRWNYLFIIPQLVDVLMVSNSLFKLHINFEDDLLGQPTFARSLYPDKDLAELLSPLSKLRDIWRVSFTGSLPRCYTAPLRISMESPVGKPTLTLWGIQPTGELEEVTCEDVEDEDDLSDVEDDLPEDEDDLPEDEDDLSEDNTSDTDAAPPLGSEDYPIEIDTD